MELVKEAPVYYPSPEEFKNPMKFIASIRDEAEQAGICKIVPPAGWKPFFAVDPAQFRFHTRVQNLTKVDGVARVEREFLMDVRKFHFKRGVPMGDRPLPSVPSLIRPGAEEPLRLFQLYRAVESLGGPSQLVSLATCTARIAFWRKVADAMFPAHSVEEAAAAAAADKNSITTATSHGKQALHETLATAYERYILPFVLTPSDDDLKAAAPVAESDADVEALLSRALRSVAQGFEGARAGKAGDVAAECAVRKATHEASTAHEPTFAHEEVEVHFVPDPSIIAGVLLGNDGEPIRKKRRGRAPKVETLVRRTAESARTIRVRKPRLCQRLAPRRDPEVVLGAKFYKYFPDVKDCLVGQILEAVLDDADLLKIDPTSREDVERGALHMIERAKVAKSFKVRYTYEEEGRVLSHEDTVDRESAVMLLASGSSRMLAREAALEGICQICTRADSPATMLLCDGCNYGYHANCLQPAPREIPAGDWFCSVCMEDDDDDDEDEDLQDGEADETDDDVEVGKGLNLIMAPALKQEDESKAEAAQDTDHVMAEVVASNGTSDATSRPASAKAKHDRVPKRIASFGFGEGQTYSIPEYEEMGNTFREKYLNKARESQRSFVAEALAKAGTPEGDEALEKEYWRLVSEMARTDMNLGDIKVSYGSDLDTGTFGSGFPTADRPAPFVDPPIPASEISKYRDDPWNLNNFPKLPGSLLQYVGEDITGVIVPWLYMGMFFSSFCWHTEDHYFASINYHHWGAPKTWYGVPSSGAAKFESAARKLTPDLFSARPDVLTGIVTQFNPGEVARAGAPVYHLIQRPGDFVLTFPQAYHGGFNHGINCAEAVNFATPRWLPFGDACVERYVALNKNPVIAHSTLLLSLAAQAAAGASQVGDTAQDKEAYALARKLYPSLAQLVLAEFDLRTRCENAGLTVISEEPEHLAQARQNNRNQPAAGDGAMSRMGAMPPQNKNRGSTRVISGRERAENSTVMSRMGGASGGDAQLQCKVCRRFCTLSLVVRRPEISASQGAVGTATKFAYCLAHGLNAGRPSSLEVLHIVPTSKLEETLDLLAERLTALNKWRQAVWTAYRPEEAAAGAALASLDRLPHDCLLELCEMNGMSAARTVSTNCVLAPGATCVLRSLQASGETGAEASQMLMDLAGQEFGIVECEEIAALRTSGQALEALRREAAKMLGASRSNLASWSRCDEVEALAAEFGGESSRVTEVVTLASRAKMAREWERKALAWKEALSEDPFREDAATSLLSAQDARAQHIRLRVAAGAEDAVGLAEACKWLQGAKALMDRSPPAPARDAKKHLDARPALPPQLAAHPVAAAFAERVGKASEWETRYSRQSREAQNAMEMVRLQDGLNELEFRPPREMEAELRAAMDKINLWLQDARALVERLDAPNSSDRWREAQLAKFIEDGAALGISEANFQEMREIACYMAAVRAWRHQHSEALLLCNLHPSEQQKQQKVQQELAAGGGGPRAGTVEDRDVLRTVLRGSYACIDQEALAHQVRGGGDKGQRRGASKTKLYCVCRKPDMPDAFMFACDSCDEWYHPHCLATTQERVQEIGRFHCPTCIYDGKVLEKPAKVPDKYCYCQKDHGDHDPMVQCDGCSDWYHPLCVGISLHEAREIKHFYCPACRLRAGKRPMVNLFCSCRKPDFGTSDFNLKMLGCENCSEWFHGVCIGLSDAAIERLASGSQRFFCQDCCQREDVPYLVDQGRSGFLAAYDHVRAIQTQAASDASVTTTSGARVMLSNVSEAMLQASLDRARKLQVVIPEERPLANILKSVGEWRKVAGALELDKTPTRELWRMLFANASMPPDLGVEEAASILFELLLRYLRYLSVHGKREDKIEARSHAGQTNAAAAAAMAAAPFHCSARTRSALFEILEAPAVSSLLAKRLPTLTEADAGLLTKVAHAISEQRQQQQQRQQQKMLQAQQRQQQRREQQQQQRREQQQQQGLLQQQQQQQQQQQHLMQQHMQHQQQHPQMDLERQMQLHMEMERQLQQQQQMQQHFQQQQQQQPPPPFFGNGGVMHHVMHPGMDSSMVPSGSHGLFQQPHGQSSGASSAANEAAAAAAAANMPLLAQQLLRRPS